MFAWLYIVLRSVLKNEWIDGMIQRTSNFQILMIPC